MLIIIIIIIIKLNYPEFPVHSLDCPLIFFFRTLSWVSGKCVRFFQPDSKLTLDGETVPQK